MLGDAYEIVLVENASDLGGVNNQQMKFYFDKSEAGPDRQFVISDLFNLA